MVLFLRTDDVVVLSIVFEKSVFIPVVFLVPLVVLLPFLLS